MKLIVMLGLVSGFANAATVTVSGGLTGQGYTVLVTGVPPHDFYLAAGSWDTATSTWTQFGLAWLDVCLPLDQTPIRRRFQSCG